MSWLTSTNKQINLITVEEGSGVATFAAEWPATPLDVGDCKSAASPSMSTILTAALTFAQDELDPFDADVHACEATI